MKLTFVSLGCDKNLVDTEMMIGMLQGAGYEFTDDENEAEIAVVNTCCFIGDAKEESINTLLELAELKKEGNLKILIAAGCLAQRYRQEILEEIPEVDALVGTMAVDEIVQAVEETLSGKRSEHYRDINAAPVYGKKRSLTTGGHYAYLKIAEGCNRFCAFCAIPLITGRFTSRPVEEIVDEVKMLAGRGVREVNVIAQELTSYGLDIYGRLELPRLIDAIAAVEGIEWIRLHYAYPADFPEELLDAMARNKKVCRYLDIALQHVSDSVLQNMRRHITGAETRALLAKIRERVPDIHIRTTLMVGFPGEEDADFEELLEFVREQRFERMGAFAYCEEEDTYAARHFQDEIPADVKQSRLDRLMALQEEISMEIQSKKVGQVLTVIVDREENDYYVGRSEFDSPEVDPEILIEKSEKLRSGDFCEVEITEALPFELIGRLVRTL